MLKPLTALTALVLLAACAVPLPSAQVAQPAAPATAAAEVLLPATPPPAPATLETALIVTQWDEAGETTSIVPVDPGTGEAVEGYAPLVLGEGFSSARSADGRLLATLIYGGRSCDAWAGGTRCQPDQGRLHVIDLSAWRDTATTVQVPGHASFMLFSPDGRYLALGQADWPTPAVLLVDVERGALAAETTLGFFPTQAAFSPDGAQLYLYGRHYDESNGLNPETHVAALDTAELAVHWQTPLPGLLDGQYVPAEAQNVHDESVWWMPAVVFAPETARLYAVHADEERLTTVDFAAQTVGAVEIAPARSWLDRLMALTASVAEAKILNGTEKHGVLAADGQRLYVTGAHMDTGDGGYSRTPLGLQVIDAATGVELLRRGGLAGPLALAPSGGHLFVTDWSSGTRTAVIAPDDLATVTELAGREILIARLVNGQPALLALHASAQAVSVQWLDPVTLTEFAAWTAPPSLWLVP